MSIAVYSVGIYITNATFTYAVHISNLHSYLNRVPLRFACSYTYGYVQYLP
jgi:hypothetical protein